MANLTGNPTGPFSTTVRQLETTDPAHPNTWNPNYQQLITNDAFLKNFIDTILKAVGGHNHNGTDGNGPKIPIESLAEDIATQAELNAHIGSRDTAHAIATTTQAGFMSAADKTKLDGVSAGANNYTHPSTHPPSIITQDASNRFVTDAEKAAWNAKLNESVYTAADVLAKIKTVDGAGSGLDADLVDGYATGTGTAANTIPVRDSSGKLPGSITGDAASVGGQTLSGLDARFTSKAAGDSLTTRMQAVEEQTGKVDLGTSQVRINAGRWEYNDGTGWKVMSMVKSVQRGVFTQSLMTNNQQSFTVTINAVDPAKSYIISSSALDTGSSYSGNVRVTLTNATTITMVTSPANPAGKVTVDWQVIELA